jgi:hypothetical protein
MTVKPDAFKKYDHIVEKLKVELGYADEAMEAKQIPDNHIEDVKIGSLKPANFEAGVSKVIQTNPWRQSEEARSLLKEYA